jgi:hypothetical protein
MDSPFAKFLREKPQQIIRILLSESLMRRASLKIIGPVLYLIAATNDND